MLRIQGTCPSGIVLLYNCPCYCKWKDHLCYIIQLKIPTGGQLARHLDHRYGIGAAAARGDPTHMYGAGTQ